MKRLSIIPEIFIWLAFSVVAGFGYAFSFFEYIGGRAEMSAADIVIPTLVWLLLAVVCSMLLRLAQKTQCFIHFSKYESLFLECSVLILLLTGGWVFRFTEHFQGIWPVNPDNEFFEYAQVTQKAAAYMNPHPASRLYVGFLHIIFMLLGNIYEAGALTQSVLLMLGVVFWYLAIRKTFGTVAALFFTAGAMLLPDSIVASMQYNPMMLLFAVYGLLAWMIAGYAKGKSSGLLAFISELVLGALIGAAVLLDISGWILVIAGGFALRQHRENCQKRSFLTPVAGCIGVILGVKAFSYVQSVVYGMSLAEADVFYSYANLTLRIPDLAQIKEFFFGLGTHPIFIVAIAVIVSYWFVKRRQASTWVMLGVLFLFGVQLFELDTYMQHDFLIYMGVIVLLGLSIQQYLQAEVNQTAKSVKEKVRDVKALEGDTTELPDLSFMDDRKEKEGIQLSDTAAKEEPVVTVINFEDQPAVTVPEKEQERAVIFIPKSMEIPKRVSKPKVGFAVEVAEDKMHFDVQVEENADFDI